MVLYCLQHDWHLDSTLDKIDSWQCRLLRRTIRVKTTYIDRSKPNEWVYQHARATRLSQTIQDRQVKYFAHIARHPQDIIHRVCYGPPYIPKQLNATRRRGRPRHHWQPHAEQLTCDYLSRGGVPPSNRQHLFTTCHNRKLILKLTNSKGAPKEAPHDAGGLARHVIGRRKKCFFCKGRICMHNLLISIQR